MHFEDVHVRHPTYAEEQVTQTFVADKYIDGSQVVQFFADLEHVRQFESQAGATSTKAS